MWSLAPPRPPVLLFSDAVVAFVADAVADAAVSFLLLMLLLLLLLLLTVLPSACYRSAVWRCC